jgi:hypothetical protein
VPHGSRQRRSRHLRRNHRSHLRRELLLDLGEPSVPGQLDDGWAAVTGEVFMSSLLPDPGGLSGFQAVITGARGVKRRGG